MSNPVFELINGIPGTEGQISLDITTPGGLEPVLTEELKNLGAETVEPGFRIVHATGTPELLYRSLYELRTAIRVLYPMYRFRIRNVEEYYLGFRDFPWEDWFQVRHTFAIDAHFVRNEMFRNSMFAVQKAKDGIADRFRLRRNVRPSVDTERPDFRIHVHVNQDLVTVSFDPSGHSLHRRGYRVAEGRAPLSEVLAAGMLGLSGWKADRELVDLFCGSGTLLVEAAMKAANIPAGKWAEEPGIIRWQHFQASVWENVKAKAEAQIKPFHFPIRGFDVDPKAIATAESILKFTGLHKYITLENSDMRKARPQSDTGIIISNPPYGERISAGHDRYLFGDLGRKLKFNFGGWQAWLLLANKKDAQDIGLRPFKKYPLMNGNIPVTLSGYSLYRSAEDIKKELNKEENP